MKTTSSPDYFEPCSMARLVLTIGGGFGLYLLRRYALVAFAVAALLAIPLIAEAGSNIKQRDTGGTVWEDASGNQVPVGDSGLTVLLENVSSASTAYVVTHKAGNIVKIYSTVFAAISTGGSDAVLDFGHENGGVYQSISSSSVGSNDPEGGVITIAATPSRAGEVDSVTFTVGTDPLISVTQGQTIWIHTDGASTNDVDATITIIIE